MRRAVEQRRGVPAATENIASHAGGLKHHLGAGGDADEDPGGARALALASVVSQREATQREERILRGKPQ